ncbi:MAG: zinc dependent phospholipase C family protein [Acidobacteriota bacterium]
MPKEITHWVIAEKTLQAMDRSPLKDLINNNKALFYFGIISFDTGFYAGGRYKKDLIMAAETLHYSQEQGSFAALSRVAKWIKNSRDPRGWAFLCGCLSHIITDSSFHPLVYYLTGDPHDPDPIIKKRANIEHRRLESRLDLFTKDLTDLDNDASVNRLLDMNDRDLVVDLVISLYRGSIYGRSAIEKAVRNHGFYYWLFGSRSLYHFFQVVNFVVRGALDLELSLFYPAPCKTDAFYFTNPKEYTDPFTGEHRSETVMQIAERVIQHTAELYEMFAQSMDIDACIDYLTKNPGPILA